MKNNKPNIIFLMVDQLSAKWLEQNNDICDTPNLDKLRSMGTTYDRAFSNNPVCCAARATIATGLTARGHGVLQNGYELSPSVPNFMQILQQNGWGTAAFGKVHFLSHFNGSHPNYAPYGFDESYITEDTRIGDWLDWIEREYPEHYESVLSTIWTIEIPFMKAYGTQEKDLATLTTEIRKRTTLVTEEFPQNNPSMYTLPFPTEISQTQWITDRAIDYFNRIQSDKPFFAHISYVQPHSPHCPPAEYMYKVKPENIPTPIEPEWINDPNAPKCFPTTEGAHTAIPDNWRDVRHYYYADIAHLDTCIGSLLDTLENNGQLENSYIFFLSDHGELLYDHGFTGKAERHYDPSIRIPLIVCGEGLAKGETCSDFVDLLDVFPTILDMAAIPLPKRPLFKDAQDSTHVGDEKKKKTYIDRFYSGQSLLDHAAPKRESVYVESYNNIESFTPQNWARTVRTDKYRYTMYPMQGGAQLFDLEKDPDETVNVVADVEYKDVLALMKDLLLDQIILQDFPHTPNNLYMLGVH